MTKIDRMGVFILVAHLVITLAVLGIYAIGSVQGHGDETLKTLLFVIMGYWFGAIGKDQIKRKKDDSNE